MSFRIIDLHCDTIYRCYNDQLDLNSDSLHISIEKLANANCMLQTFALFINTNGILIENGVNKPWKQYKELLKTFNDNISANSSIIRQAFNSKDIKKNTDEGFISALLSVEDGMCVDGDMDKLDEMYNNGVRMLTLTWNYENCFGYPNSNDNVKHSRGLKPFGIEAIEKMNNLGMIIDVSHLSEGGFYDVAKYSKKPFVASHSCARNLCSHQRNLTDKQLKTLADNGGIVGVNFNSFFLADNATVSTIDEIVNHCKYIKNIAGIDSLAWGSDFDGIDCDLEFKNYSGFNLIIDKLEKVFTDDEIDKINNKNFIRVFSEQ